MGLRATPKISSEKPKAVRNVWGGGGGWGGVGVGVGVGGGGPNIFALQTLKFGTFPGTSHKAKRDTQIECEAFEKDRADRALFWDFSGV